MKRVKQKRSTSQLTKSNSLKLEKQNFNLSACLKRPCFDIHMRAAPLGVKENQNVIDYQNTEGHSVDYQAVHTLLESKHQKL